MTPSFEEMSTAWKPLTRQRALLLLNDLWHIARSDDIEADADSLRRFKSIVAQLTTFEGPREFHEALTDALAHAEMLFSPSAAPSSSSSSPPSQRRGSDDVAMRERGQRQSVILADLVRAHVSILNRFESAAR